MQKSTLTHYTMNSKRVRESRYGEITQNDLNLLTPWVNDALQAVGVCKFIDMPAPLAHLKALVSYDAGVLAVTIVSPMSTYNKDMPWDVAIKQTIHLVSFYVVADEQYSNYAWKTIHKMSNENYGKRPAAPWVVAFLHESCMHPSVLNELWSTIPLCAAFERLVAWTLILKNQNNQANFSQN